MAANLKSDTKADVNRVFFDADAMPIQGLESYIHPLGVKEGWFTGLAGLRLDRWAARVKDGDVKLTSAAILGSSTFRGAGTFRTGLVSASNPKLFAAFHLSNFGRIFMSTDGIDFTTATAGVSGEYTASSGQFGDTRFTTATTGDPWFYIQGASARFIADPAYDVLGDTICVIQHNGNAPRVYSALYDVLGVHDEIAVPQPTSTMTVVPTFPVYLKVNTTAEMTHSTPTGTTIVTSESGTTPNAYAVVTATNPTLNDVGRITFTTAMSLGSAAGVLTSRQIVVLMDSATVNILDKYAWRIGDGTNRVTFFDPTSSTKNQPPTITPADGGGKLFWVGFSLDTIDGWDVASAGLSAVTEIDFLWAQPSEAAATYVMNIYAICGSGLNPGGRKHKISYKRAKLACESKAFRFDHYKPELISNLGGATYISGKIPAGLRIPSIDSRLYLSYKVPFQNTTQAELDKGTNYLIVYAKDVVYDPDQDRWYYERDYTYVEAITLGTFLGTWSFSSGTALSTVIYTDDGLNTAGTKTNPKKYAFKAPDSDTKPIPNGKSMAYANGRLWVAARPTTLGFSTLWISDDGHPGRFRENAKVLANGQFDPLTGTTHQFEDEDIMAIKATASRYQGVSNTFIFTDKSIWFIGRDVNRKERVATTGTLSPMSAIEHEGAFYFLSSDRRWLKLVPGQQLEDIGKSIQDKLSSIPGGSDVSTSRLYRVSSGAEGKYVKLAYGTTGSTNPYVAVYNILTGRIESVDQPTTPFTVEQFIPWVKSGIKGLYAFSSDLEFYQYEQPSSAANVTVSLATPEFQLLPGRRLAVKRPWIRSDDMASVTMTASVAYFKGTGTARTCTVSLDVSTDRNSKYFGVWSSTGDVMGTSAKLTFTATCPGGKYLYGLGAELADRGPGTGS